MGFLKEKYTLEYFTGRNAKGEKLPYGALGADEWLNGGAISDIMKSIDSCSDFKGKRVLEIGYGRGEAARYLFTEKGIHTYYGIDFSETAYDLAKRTLSFCPASRCTLVLSDALSHIKEMAFKDSFDVVIMLDTVEHIPTDEFRELLPLLHTALKDSGKLIAHTPFYEVDEDFIKQGFSYLKPTLSDLIEETKGMHCNKFTKERFLNEFLTFGFQNISERFFVKVACKPAVAEDPGFDLVELNGQTFQVKRHWFWDEFKRANWEPNTFKLYKKYLNPKSNYLDVGAWVGPTLLIAASLGVRNIYAIEPNPLSNAELSETIAKNAMLADVRLTKICITDQDHDRVPFGPTNGNETSSASSLRGSAWIVETSTLTSYLRENKLDAIDFIKIDIEGAETMLAEDLGLLSSRSGLVVLLSLHPPFWKEKKAVADLLLPVLTKFSVFDSNEQQLSAEKLEAMMLSEEPLPAWGTSFGNFFELLLKTHQPQVTGS